MPLHPKSCGAGGGVHPIRENGGADNRPFVDRDLSTYCRHHPIAWQLMGWIGSLSPPIERPPFSLLALDFYDVLLIFLLETRYKIDRDHWRSIVHSLQNF